ncbi:hypothetical protein [uncultured Bacteroides sp.]|uniref:hypothetical protein n=1 Tax=uncultured Bacteroides sp. TaxID=162156 RepID=UPI002624DDFD|nr:hypothetical protein [uncultured Bacteroides sp.]
MEGMRLRRREPFSKACPARFSKIIPIFAPHCTAATGRRPTADGGNKKSSLTQVSQAQLSQDTKERGDETTREKGKKENDKGKKLK